MLSWWLRNQNRSFSSSSLCAGRVTTTTEQLVFVLLPHHWMECYICIAAFIENGVVCWLERQSDCSLDCDDPLFGDYYCAGTWSALLRVFSGLQAELGHILAQFPKNLRPWLCLVSSFGRSAKKTAGNLTKKRLTWLADRILTRTLKNFLIFSPLEFKPRSS